jgi:thiamine monophosphate synthase
MCGRLSSYYSKGVLMSLEIKKIVSTPRPHKVKGAPSIGLYFTSPHSISGFEFPIQLGNAFREINNSPYEKNMHAMELYLPGFSAAEYATHADLIAELCKNSGISFIINGHSDLAKKYADGIISSADDKPNLTEIREEFGEEFIIGIDCKGSKKHAEKYIDNTIIDYVSFDYQGDNTIEIIEFWKSNSDRPCVVKGFIDDELCTKLVNSRVDFIGCGDYIWDRKGKVAEAVKEISKSIEKAISQKTIQ